MMVRTNSMLKKAEVEFNTFDIAALYIDSALYSFEVWLADRNFWEYKSHLLYSMKIEKWEFSCINFD